MLCAIVLACALICCAMLYVVLCCAVLWCAVVSCDVLWYAVMCCAVLETPCPPSPQFWPTLQPDEPPPTHPVSKTDLISSG